MDDQNSEKTIDFANNDQNSHQNLDNTLESENHESYFSLGLKVAELEDTDELKQTEDEQVDMVDEKNEQNEILQENHVEKQSITETENSNKITTKKDSIDDIIDKIRHDQIDNKDVCNYVLNMLVDGEFDLDKNFVIKNNTNILLMVQVIKCSNLSLKAELWSLFTALLRKSYLNLQACVEIDLIETALHELQTADNVCADLIVELLTVLASYNISVEELKSIFGMLKGENHVWVSLNF